MTAWTIVASLALGELYGGLSWVVIGLVLNSFRTPSDVIAGAVGGVILAAPIGGILGALFGIFVGVTDGFILAAVIITAVHRPFKNLQLSTLQRRIAVVVISGLGFIAAVVVASVIPGVFLTPVDPTRPITDIASGPELFPSGSADFIIRTYFHHFWILVPGILAAGSTAWASNRVVTQISSFTRNAL